MIQREIRNEAGEQVIYDNGILQSMYPGNLAMVRGHWVHFVPWFKPREVLILGYGGGTMSKVLRSVWGEDISITGVDTQEPPFKHDKDTIVLQDALKFVQGFPNDNAFDFVMVDVYEGNKIVPFVLGYGFVKECVRLTRDIVAINLIDEPYQPKAYRRAMDLKIIKIVDRNYLYFYKK